MVRVGNSVRLERRSSVDSLREPEVVSSPLIPPTTIIQRIEARESEFPKGEESRFISLTGFESVPPYCSPASIPDFRSGDASSNLAGGTGGMVA